MVAPPGRVYLMLTLKVVPAGTLAVSVPVRSLVTSSPPNPGCRLTSMVKDLE